MTESVQSVLRRLYRYYDDRAKIAGKKINECMDYQSKASAANNAAIWEAKRDAIANVAANTGIDLGKEE